MGGNSPGKKQGDDRQSWLSSSGGSPKQSGKDMPIIDIHTLSKPPTPGASLLKQALDNNNNNPNKHTKINRDSEVRNENARKLVLSSSEVNLCKLSPFLIKKVIDNFIGRPKMVRKLKTDQLLIITASSQQTKKLLQIKKFHTWSVNVKTPFNMNTVKEVVSYPGFNTLTDEEIVKDMEDQNVIGCRHFKWKNRTTNIIEPSNTVILTFKTETLPVEIDIGYEKRNVRQYIPSPLRCFNCFQFGHISDNCTNHSICSKCTSTTHTSQDCTSSVEKCTNCNETHNAFSKDCEKFQIERKIN